MEYVTAEILEGDAVLFSDIAVEIDTASRVGSFSMPPNTWLEARSFTVRASDGRSVNVIARNTTFDSMGEAVQRVTFSFASGLFE